MRKPLPNALDIDFRGGLTEEVTPHAGVALPVELGRRSGVMATAERCRPEKKSAKDELAASVCPSAKFGANAAWLRLQLLTHNRLELLKATALDRHYRQARPKRLRFAIFTQFGRVVHHARHQFVRLAEQTLAVVFRPGRWRLARAAWDCP